MGDYTDWDYSESTAGVPSSLVAYGASRKRRGATTGFDTSYTDYTKETELITRIEQLEASQTRIINTQTYIIAQTVNNLIANGDFSQWSTLPMVRTYFKNSTANNAWKMNNRVVPIADRWFLASQCSAFLTTGYVHSTANQIEWGHNAKTGTASIVQGKTAMYVAWATNATLSLYNGGDTKNRSCAMLGIQHMVQDVTQFQNRKMRLTFKVDSTVTGTGFIQISRVYSHTKAAPPTDTARNFANAVKPPGIELIKREQFIYAPGWREIEVLLDFGNLTQTPAFTKPPHNCDHGLLIQVGPLYYYNVKNSNGGLVLEQYGDAGGALGLFKPTAGHIGMTFADFLLHDGQDKVPFVPRDEKPYTLPFVFAHGKSQQYRSGAPTILCSGPQLASSDPDYADIWGGNTRLASYRIPHPVRMANVVTNVHCVWHETGTPSNNGINAVLTHDHLLYGSYTESISGSQRRHVLMNGYGQTHQRQSRAYHTNIGATMVALQSFDYCALHQHLGSESDQLLRNVVKKNLGNSEYANSNYGYQLVDATRDETMLFIATGDDTATTAPIYGELRTDLNTYKAWFVMYAREADWGPIDANAEDTEGIFPHTQAAYGTICFPKSFIA
jgi:hypothetical protein